MEIVNNCCNTTKKYVAVIAAGTTTYSSDNKRKGMAEDFAEPSSSDSQPANNKPRLGLLSSSDTSISPVGSPRYTNQHIIIAHLRETN